MVELTNFFAPILLLIMAAVFFIFKKYNSSGLKISGGSILAQYSRDLTKAASDKKLDPVIGREREIERVIQVLARRTKNNPVLVGEAGVGKTAIAEGLALAIVTKQVPKALQTKRVLALDLTGIIAGTKYRGEFEKRLKQIADEIIASQRSIILFIDEIHILAQAGGAEGALDADDILKPALARGELQVIGATTAKEYEQFIKQDATLDRRLHPILVDEPTQAETITILKGIKVKYEKFHNVKITDEAILTAVKLASKHIKNKSFPDKAIDLIDEASSKVGIANLAKSRNQGQAEPPVVGPNEVRAVMDEWLESQLI